jgi:hypothetical protein
VISFERNKPDKLTYTAKIFCGTVECFLLQGWRFVEELKAFILKSTKSKLVCGKTILMEFRFGTIWIFLRQYSVMQ